MGKRLVITEKPSVARDIAAAIGGFDTDGDYFENDDYVVTWAIGHLLTLAEPQDYNKEWKGWTLGVLPMIPDKFKVKPRDGQKKRLDMIRKLGRRKDVDSLINACDAGREGEIIFRRITDYTGLDSKAHERLWLQSMTANAIRTGFEDLRSGSELDNLGDAAWLRGVGDWLIGMNATRALTKRLKGRRERGAWSAGRVQTPTLKVLVDREWKILQHDPETFWEITATISHGDVEWDGQYYDAGQRKEEDSQRRPNRIFDRVRVDEVLAAVGDGVPGVASETRKKSTQNPPLPFDLTSLQREANRKFSFSAKRTLQSAQRLYEAHKALTYPRTDSRHLPDDYEETLREVLASLEEDFEYAKLATGIVEVGPLNLKKVIDGSKVSDHFAIIPTGRHPEGLSADDSRIYDLVVRQFLSALMGPATWDVVERFVDVVVPDAEGARFRTTARSLEVPGFLEALGQEAGKGTTLPSLVAGQLKVDGIDVSVLQATEEEKVTQPAARYTEAALLRLMETAGEDLDDDELSEAMRGRGLGTPATRADIIERLVSTQYARRVAGKLMPTPKGMRLVDVLVRAQVPTLASPKLTGAWENNLRMVQTGEMVRQEALDELVEFTRRVTESLKTFEHDELYSAEPSIGPCPACGEGQVRETAWGYQCDKNTGKGDGCTVMVWKDRGGRYIDRKLATRLITDLTVGPVGGFVDRYGRELEATLILEKDPEKDKWALRTEYGASASAGPNGEPEEAVGPLFPCPCETDGCQIVETNLRYVCKRVLDGESRGGPILPKVVCHRTISAEEAGLFFGEVGKTEILEGFISKRGRPFRGLLFRKPTGKHGFEFPPREKKEPAPKKKKASTSKARVSRKKTTTTATGEDAAVANKKALGAKKKPADRKKPAASTAAAKKKRTPSSTAAAKKKPAVSTTTAKKRVPAKKAPAKKTTPASGDKKDDQPSA